MMVFNNLFLRLMLYNMLLNILTFSCRSQKINHIADKAATT